MAEKLTTHRQLFIRPVVQVKPDGSEKLLSLALCAERGPGNPLIDKSILDHFSPDMSGLAIKKIAEEFHDVQADSVIWTYCIFV